MATRMVRQTMFTMGQVDPINYKRTDLEFYLSAAQRLLNVEVGTTQFVKKRKSTKYLIDMTPYAISTSQMYEFTDANDNFYLVLSDNLSLHIFTVSVTNVVTFLQTVTTTYLAADLPALDYVNDNDSLIFTHPNYAPSRLYISNYTGPVFSFQVLTLNPYPAFDFNTVAYNGYTISYSISGSVLSFVVTNPALAPTGFDTTWIGGQIIGAGNSPEDPVGYAIITNVSNASNVTTFTANIQIPFLASGFSTFGSQYSIRQPAFGDPTTGAKLGWPAKVLFYQNRLWFASTRLLPGTVFGAKINQPINFDVGVGKDTDAIVYSLGQSNSGDILWMNGGKQLEIFTENYEFAAPQNQAVGLTPSTFSIRQQSALGSSKNFKPINYFNDTYFLSKDGTAIINFHFNGIGETYQASNISVASQKLVKNPVGGALLRASPNDQDNFIYFLNPDFSITSMQFASEHKFCALTDIDFVSNLNITSLVSVNNNIFLLEKDTITNSYSLQVFDRSDENVKLDSWITSTMNSAGLIMGLHIFNGSKVRIIFNDQDYGDSQQIVGGEFVSAPVSAGQCYAFNPNGFFGTVKVGYLYNVIITPMYIFAGALESNFYKNISRIFVDVFNSMDFSINGLPIPYQTYTSVQDETLTPITDTIIVNPVRGWNRFDTFSITQYSPFDLQVTAIAYQISATII